MKPARLKIAAKTRSLSRIRSFVRAQSVKYGLTAAQADDIVMAVDEACANIVIHAYGPAAARPGGKTKPWIEIGTDPVRRGIEIRIRDRGERFNPLSIPANESDIAERARKGDKSGRGVFAIRKFADKAVHRYRAGEGNELILRKYNSGIGAD